MELGQPLGLVPAGLGARDTLRLEAGMPLYGHELSEQINPFQAGLGFACHLAGYDFPGRDALLRIQKPAAARRSASGWRCRPVAGRREQAARFWPRKSRSARSPAAPIRRRSASRLRWATSRPEFAQPGIELEIDIRGRLEPARVVELPFYRRPNKPQRWSTAKRKEAASMSKDLLVQQDARVGPRRGRSGRRQDRHRGPDGVCPGTLTDLVFVDLPPVGRQVKAGEPFGEIESVKAVSDLYSPVDGQVMAVNAAIADHLDHLADDPYQAGWFIKIKIAGEAGLADLLDEAAYKKQCEEEQH